MLSVVVHHIFGVNGASYGASFFVLHHFCVVVRYIFGGVHHMCIIFGVVHHIFFNAYMLALHENKLRYNYLNHNQLVHSTHPILALQ